MPETIGIYGGTFDPPHLGHLTLASQAGQQLSFNRLLWVLTPQPPHKTIHPITPLKHRFEMLRLMIEELHNHEISTVEMDRPAPHYTSDSLRLLHLQHPQAKLVLVVGGDSLANLLTWHAPQEIINYCNWLAVMRRPADQINLKLLEENLPGITEKIKWVDAPLLEIASREIRQQIANGNQEVQRYLHKKVYDYIQQNQLYR